MSLGLDPDSRAALQRLAGESAAIPAALHGRIRGDDLASLQADAAQLAHDLGIAPAQERQRGADGRFGNTSDMTQRIRRAAGRA